MFNYAASFYYDSVAPTILRDFAPGPKETERRVGGDEKRRALFEFPSYQALALDRPALVFPSLKSLTFVIEPKIQIYSQQH